MTILDALESSSIHSANIETILDIGSLKTVLKNAENRSPYGRGSESVPSVYSDRQSRDHRERSAQRVFQHRPQAAPRFYLLRGFTFSSIASGAAYVLCKPERVSTTPPT